MHNPLRTKGKKLAKRKYRRRNVDEISILKNVKCNTIKASIYLKEYPLSPIT